MTHHSIAAHVFVVASVTQAVSVWALLASFPAIPVLVAVTMLAVAMGWLGELTQRMWGWGTYDWRDIAITTAGGPLGWALAMGALHV